MRSSFFVASTRLSSVVASDARRSSRRYEAERRPAAAANVALAVDNWRRGLEIPSALGLPPRALDAFAATAGAARVPRPVFAAATKAARAAALLAASYPDPRLAAVLEREAELPLFFPHHDLGLRYDGASAAAAAEAALDGARPASKAYVPALAPGERLPECAAAHRLDPTRHTLLVLDDDDDAAAVGTLAAAAAAEAPLPALLRVDREPAASFGAPDLALALVRPDRYVAATWRRPTDAAALRDALRAALFCRPTAPEAPPPL